MTTELIKIYHADDNDRGVKFIQFTEALLSYFGITAPRDEFSTLDVGKGIELLKTYVSYIPSSTDFYKTNYNFNEVMNHIKSDTLEDIMIIDLKWENVNKLAGKELISAIVYRKEDVKIYMNTAYSKELISDIADVVARDKIGAIPDNPTKNDITIMFQRTLKDIAKKYLNRIGSSEKSKLLNICQNNLEEKDLLDVVIDIEDKKWYLKNLLLCCYNPESKQYEKIKYTIKELLIPNLSLAASECFGINGLKQATHPIDQGYYARDSWYSKAINQVITFKQVLKEGTDILENKNPPIILPSLRDSFKNLDEVLNILQIEKNSNPPINNLQENIRSNFRFGTSNNSTSINFNNVKKITGINFEVYFPIHWVYKEEFRGLQSNCTNVKFASYETEETMQEPIIKWNEDKTPKLCREFMIFEQCGADNYDDDIPIKRLPDYFEIFYSRRFDMFGKMLFVRRKQRELKLFDCTYKPYTEKNLYELNKGLPQGDDGLCEYLYSKIGDVKAFFIFEFNCWRQL